MPFRDTITSNQLNSIFWVITISSLLLLAFIYVGVTQEWIEYSLMTGVIAMILVLIVSILIIVKTRHESRNEEGDR